MTTCEFHYRIIGDLAISYSTAGQLDEKVWNAFLKEVDSKPIRSYIGANDGNTEVTSTQRKSASEWMKRKKVKSVVITDSTIVRGLATAVSWLGADIAAFSWADLPKAMKHLKVTPTQEEQAIHELTTLKRTYGKKSA